MNCSKKNRVVKKYSFFRKKAAWGNCKKENTNKIPSFVRKINFCIDGEERGDMIDLHNLCHYDTLT